MLRLKNYVHPPHVFSHLIQSCVIKIKSIPPEYLPAIGKEVADTTCMFTVRPRISVTIFNLYEQSDFRRQFGLTSFGYHIAIGFCNFVRRTKQKLGYHGHH